MIGNMVRGCIRLAAVSALFSLPTGGRAQTETLRMPPVFSDNMMLQRDQQVPVWGWAPPGTDVSVKVAGNDAIVKAGDDGKWVARLAPMEAGGPHQMTVRADGESITFGNVLVGEVWFASGQSNMEMTLTNVENGPAEVAAADWPDIRILAVYGDARYELQDSVTTSGWKECSPETVPHFTAAGYFFGRKLHQELDVPIGIISNTWGGSAIEAWISRESLEAEPKYSYSMEQLENWHAASSSPETQRLYADQLKAWNDATKGSDFHDDPGDDGESLGWAKPALDDAEWGSAQMPSPWEQTSVGAIDGVVWFRKTVEIPEKWAENELTLHLGTIDDFDVTYFNGHEIGRMGPETPDTWAKQRIYTVPAGLVQTGTNVIAIRVFDRLYGGGLTGNKPDLFLSNGEEKISLVGDWKYRVAVELPSKPERPGGNNIQHIPTLIYNGKLAPVAPYGIRGVIWYQGETNAGKWDLYRSLFKTMVTDWRDIWNRPDLPFISVQLAGFRAWQQNEWAYFREVQLELARQMENHWVVTAADIGDLDDIHPRNKKDVGLRLAAAALANVYGKNIPWMGPVYADMMIDGRNIHISFDRVGGGLESKTPEVLGFEIAGENREFHPAKAELHGDKVVVSCETVEEPVAVRYAWQNFPTMSLYTKEGLPVFPFRTDDWPKE